MQVVDASFDEKVGTLRLMRLSLTNKASTYHVDMVSAMVKLMREIVESSSDVIGCGMVFHSTTSSRDDVWRATLSSLGLLNA